MMPDRPTPLTPQMTTPSRSRETTGQRVDLGPPLPTLHRFLSPQYQLDPGDQFVSTDSPP